jgi:hypothetical protein
LRDGVAREFIDCADDEQAGRLHSYHLPRGAKKAPCQLARGMIDECAESL